MPSKDTLISDNGPFLVLTYKDPSKKDPSKWELSSSCHILLTDATAAYHKAISEAEAPIVELWEAWPFCDARQVLGYYSIPSNPSKEEDSL